jgi:hypothetical protein
VVLVLHNRYRTHGGEERAVHDLAWLAREHLHRAADVLERVPLAGPGAECEREGCTRLINAARAPTVRFCSASCQRAGGWERDAVAA